MVRLIREANEVPLRFFKHYQQLRPNSNVAKLIDKSLVSSMGQGANRNLTRTPKHTYKLKNIRKFLNQVLKDQEYSYEIDAAMIPQYSLKFNSEAEARACFTTIEESKKHFQNIHITQYRN